MTTESRLDSGDGRSTRRKGRRSITRARDAAALVSGTLLGVATAGVWVGVGGIARTLDSLPVAAPAYAMAGGEEIEALHTTVEVVEALKREAASLAPKRKYVVIDRANNRLWLWRAGEVVLEAVVSTGSGTILREAGGEEREWVFDTPPGRFEVLGKRPNPIWTKPDWAFLEEGLEPPVSGRDRVERGSLGEWAFDLGDGYMIHGTLYERLLGRSITHGCVRVGRDDLRVLANEIGIATPVFIF